MLFTSSESETDKILLQPAKTAQILLNLSVTELSLLRFSETELFLPKLPETELILTNELRGCSLKSIVLFLSRRLFSQVQYIHIPELLTDELRGYSIKFLSQPLNLGLTRSAGGGGTLVTTYLQEPCI